MKPIDAAIAEIQRQYPAPAEQGALKVIVGLMVATFLLGAFFWMLESIWPEDAAQSRWRRESRTNLTYWFFDFFVDRKLASLGVFLVVLVLVLLRVPRANTWVAHQPLGLQAIEMLLLGDFIGYWVHRAMHQVPVLWRFHAVHHSSAKLDWLAAARVHPLESVITKLAAIIPMFLLGFSSGITALYGPFLGFYPIFIHSNLRWGYGRIGLLISSPSFHRWHHSADADARDRNFSGLFPFFDYLFGTAYFPRHRHPIRYGIDGEPVPEGIVRQLAYPFRRQSLGS